MYILEISIAGFFDTSFDLFKEKSYRLIEGSMCAFCKLKSPLWKQQFNILKNGFFITKSLDVKITGPSVQCAYAAARLQTIQSGILGLCWNFRTIYGG
jgi:hypothetical protein